MRKPEIESQPILEALPMPAVIAGVRDGRILYANELFGQAFGLPDQDLTGAVLPDLYYNPEDRQLLLEALAKSGSVSNYEVQAKRVDGAAFWATVSLRSLVFQEEPAILSTFNDISERKRLEQELHRSKKMDALGRLAGGVAHDFNNVLTIILGISMLALNRLGQSDLLRGDLEEIKKAAERAASLTQQLLAFSGRQMRGPSTLDLGEVVAALQTMLQRLIGEDINLEIASDPEPGHVKADRAQLEQIVMNLVVNARDAMPHGGKLTLQISGLQVGDDSAQGRVMAAGPYVVLTAKDTGQGMDAETRSRVFEPFFTTKGPGMGTGLGLSTVYGIVKQLGGHICVESDLGSGTTFTVYLPKVEPAGAVADAEQDRATLPRGTETILLVEDEPGVRALVSETLQVYGYTVLEARHGIEALLIGTQYGGTISLLMTDVVMPQMSGREVADRLLPLRPRMKVLYTSGYTEEAVVHYGVENAAQDFLPKPFSPEGLVRKVRNLLDREASA
jgi:two-component system cell cycle sensor histidine kinase/response regulator CckA